MWFIGVAMPSDIIINTVEFSKKYEHLFPLLYFVNLLIGIGLCILGFIFAIFYLIILNNGNVGGYSLISFGIMIFAFLFTSQQVQENKTFIENVKGRINLEIDFTNFIENREKIENELFLSRIFLYLGIGVCIIGLILFTMDVLNSTIYTFQFRYLVLISIGYAFMNYGWGKERMAMNSIIQSKILSKLDSV